MYIFGKGKFASCARPWPWRNQSSQWLEVKSRWSYMIFITLDYAVRMDHKRKAVIEVSSARVRFIFVFIEGLNICVTLFWKIFKRRIFSVSLLRERAFPLGNWIQLWSDHAFTRCRTKPGANTLNFIRLEVLRANHQHAHERYGSSVPAQLSSLPRWHLCQMFVVYYLRAIVQDSSWIVCSRSRIATRFECII